MAPSTRLFVVPAIVVMVCDTAAAWVEAGVEFGLPRNGDFNGATTLHFHRHSYSSHPSAKSPFSSSAYARLLCASALFGSSASAW